ncbi:hypothetical protein L596_021388 [Steinernema carpocapsae]|uniref:Uncharacterized protein n=1 Tax=Steinernema carpocapsae TaxID=34508 RepID=A0A4U5MIM2_STECR|nr:hypothetical protein L596_021388 [Steinernema carpocapsae]
MQSYKLTSPSTSPPKHRSLLQALTSIFIILSYVATCLRSYIYPFYNDLYENDHYPWILSLSIALLASSCLALLGILINKRGLLIPYMVVQSVHFLTVVLAALIAAAFLVGWMSPLYLLEADHWLLLWHVVWLSVLILYLGSIIAVVKCYRHVKSQNCPLHRFSSYLVCHFSKVDSSLPYFVDRSVDNNWI